MKNALRPLFVSVSLLALAACGSNFDRAVGAAADNGQFGNATMNNMLIQTGQKSFSVALGERFAAEVPTTITFAFNSAELTDEARTTLRNQADWIRQFPEIRFRVYGHTDLVGSNAYNKALGLRRAQAAVAYLTSQGINGARLEAIVSYGKTRPVIQTPGPEERNRRTVTEVSGLVSGHPTLLNGKYAAIIHRDYIQSAEWRHPPSKPPQTVFAPTGG
jgi:peptidoglycan-associated lipoprotein